MPGNKQSRKCLAMLMPYGLYVLFNKVGHCSKKTCKAVKHMQCDYNRSGFGARSGWETFRPGVGNTPDFFNASDVIFARTAWLFLAQFAVQIRLSFCVLSQSQVVLVTLF